MLFNSYIFILFFLPLSLVLYFGLNRLGKEQLAKLVLIGMSLWFYAYFHISYLVLILASILFNYLWAQVLLNVNKRDKGRLAKCLLAFGILADVGVIFYFKYFNFFLDNVETVTGLSFPVEEILMPLGISFFTFQQISYLVDSYRGETGAYSFVDYVLFVTFFPQLVAGPIVLHQEMIPQFNEKSRKRINQEMLARGIYLFAVGLFKKVMIADVLGKGVDWGFGSPELLTAPDVIIVSLLYTLQIYFDFSGYCDMACGIANMFHLELPVNFNSPYKATSILEFWQRWHMTLTRFLRKYIYFPLGGSRKGTTRNMLNVFIVFLISGIWHGAAWTYILWGILHGVANILCRVFRGVWERVPKVLAWLLTFIFVNLSWIFFRAESLKQAFGMLGKLFHTWELRISSELLGCFDLLEFTYIEEHIGFLGNMVKHVPFIHLAIILVTALGIALFARNCHEKKFVPKMSNALGSVVLMVWSILSLSGLSTFLYFNF